MTQDTGRDDLSSQDTSSQPLLEKLIREVQENATSDTDTPPASPSQAGGILGGLASNPALIQALPQLLSSLGRLSGGASTHAEGNPHPRSNSSASMDRHTALLCALKPYLGKERRQAADYMINFCKVWSTLQSMGISLPMLLSSFTGERGEDK